MLTFNKETKDEYQGGADKTDTELPSLKEKFMTDMKAEIERKKEVF